MRKVQGKIKSKKLEKRMRRKLSIRSVLSGTVDRPRVSITRSNKNLFVQVVDDSAGKTLFSVQTFGKNAVGKSSNKDSAKLVGEKVAEGLKKSKIDKVVFDRSGYKYHGVVSVLADTIRESGIQV